MPVKTFLTFLMGFIVLLYFPFLAAADELSPPGSKPLSAILKSVEEGKSGLIMEAEFDDGWWEVKTCQAGACQKLYIDPMTGTENRRRRTGVGDDLLPDKAMPLSTIIQSVEDKNLGVVTEAELDDGFWEIKVRKNGQKTKLHIEPVTGNVKKRGVD